MGTIKKLESGVVALDGFKSRYKTAQFTNASVSLLADGTTFEVREAGQVVTSFSFADVQSTQVEPNAAIPAPATAELLLTLLGEEFFF
jgi:hypothetical protein